jgi:hypothetical protein
VPAPAQVDPYVSPLAQTYGDAWTRVQALQQNLIDDPRHAAQRQRLLEMQRSIAAEMEALDEPTRLWLQTAFPQVYASGAASGGFAEQTWSQIHQQAVQDLAQRLYKDLLTATSHVTDSAKRLVREIGHDQALQLTIQGQTAKQAGAAMAAKIEKSGIHAMRYADGSKHGLTEYSQMAMRTMSGNAYNVGSLRAGADSGITLWECFDGPNCGWEEHGSPTTANGMIVTLDEAMAYPLSHPNCRRSFGGRPDLDSGARPGYNENVTRLEGEDAYNAIPDPTSLTADEQAAADEYVSSSEEINGSLRSSGGVTEFPHMSGDNQDLVETLDGLMARSAATDPMTLWRGMALPQELAAQPDLVGYGFSDHAFISTSADRRIAEKFVKYAGDYAGNTPVLVRIETESGQAMIAPGRLASYEREREALLPRGSRFSVVSDTTVDGQRVLSVRMARDEIAVPKVAEAPVAVRDPHWTPAEAAAVYDPYTRGLATAQSETVAEYTVATYTDMNRMLRGGNIVATTDEIVGELSQAQWVERIATMDTVIEQAPTLPRDMAVYRGGQGMPDLKVGSVFTDLGFGSTSVDRQMVEESFIGGSNTSLFRIRLPEGSRPGAYVEGITATPGQYEMLLKRGTSYRVAAIKRGVETELGDTVDLIDLELVETASRTVESTVQREAARTFENPKTAQEWVLKEHGGRAGFTRDQANAVKHWQQGDFRRINTFMRTGEVEVPVFGGFGDLTTVMSVQEMRAHRMYSEASVIEHLPVAMTKRALSEEVTLWRGANLPELAQADPTGLIGQEITDRGFVATSASKDSAASLSFGQFHAADNEAGVLFEIRAPAGTHYASPEAFVRTGFAEVVLPPGSRMRVVGVHDEQLATNYHYTGINKGGPTGGVEQTWRIRRIEVELING